MLKSILKLDSVQTINRSSLKKIQGGDFGDVGLPDVGSGPINLNRGSDAGVCTSSGWYWNAECNRCEDPSIRYFANGCEQIF